MTTVKLLPDGDGDAASPAFGTNDGGTSYYTYIDDPVGADDGDTTYLYSLVGGSGADWCFSMSDPPSLGGPTINSIAVSVVARRVIDGSVQAAMLRGIRLSGTTNFASEDIVTSTGFNTFTSTFSRPGGGSWVEADLASLQVELKYVKADSDSGILITAMYVTVDYTPATPSTPPKRSNYKLRVRR